MDTICPVPAKFTLHINYAVWKEVIICGINLLTCGFYLFISAQLLFIKKNIHHATLQAFSVYLPFEYYVMTFCL